MGRSWRTFATGVSFIIFGLGSLVMSALVLPAIAFVSADANIRRRRVRAVIGASFRTFLRFIELVGLVRFDVDHTLKVVEGERGSLVVANHPTLLDVVVLLAHLEQSNCVVKGALWKNPLLSWPMRAAGYIPNGDAERLIAECEKALSLGETLIIFPEATRTRPGYPIRLQRGAANVALRSHATIRVVHIACEPALLTKGNPWYRVPKRQPCFVTRAGVSVRARDYLGRGENRATAARNLTRTLQLELSKEIWRDERAGARTEATSH